LTFCMLSAVRNVDGAFRCCFGGGMLLPLLSLYTVAQITLSLARNSLAHPHSFTRTRVPMQARVWLWRHQDHQGRTCAAQRDGATPALCAIASLVTPWFPQEVLFMCSVMCDVWVWVSRCAWRHLAVHLLTSSSRLCYSQRSQQIQHPTAALIARAATAQVCCCPLLCNCVD